MSVPENHPDIKPVYVSQSDTVYDARQIRALLAGAQALLSPIARDGKPVAYSAILELVARAAAYADDVLEALERTEAVEHERQRQAGKSVAPAGGR